MADAFGFAQGRLSTALLLTGACFCSSVFRGELRDRAHVGACCHLLEGLASAFCDILPPEFS